MYVLERLRKYTTKERSQRDANGRMVANREQYTEPETENDIQDTYTPDREGYCGLVIVAEE